MLDLLYTLRAADGSAGDDTAKCAWQDIPGRVKLDSENREVALTASYKHLLRQLQEGAPAVIQTCEELAAAVAADDRAGHTDAARDARVAGGWLRRLARRDFASTTWDSDYSRLNGFWACLRDARVGLETAMRGDDDDDDDGDGDTNGRHDRPLATVARYVHDLAQLQPEIDRIERSRTTLAQRVCRGLHATMAALRMGAVEDCDDFWNESAVGSSTR